MDEDYSDVTWEEENSASLLQFWEIAKKIEPSFHSLQILQLDPNPRGTGGLFFCGTKIDQVQQCINEFVFFDEARLPQSIAQRTLAFDACKKPAGEWLSWSTADDRHLARTGFDLNPKIVEDRQSFDALTPIECGMTLDAKLKFWKGRLESRFIEGGSSLWLTITHRNTDNSGNLTKPIKSQIYLFFSKPDLESDLIVRDQIVDVARSYLYDRVLVFYENEIKNFHWKFGTALKSYLNDYDPSTTLSAKTVENLNKRLPFLRLALPIVIEGERGTGKMTAATHIAEGCRRAAKDARELTGKQDGSSTEIVKVNCSMHPEGLVKWLANEKRALYLPEKSFVPVLKKNIILDDFHLASKSDQQQFMWLVDRILGREIGDDGFDPSCLPDADQGASMAGRSESARAPGAREAISPQLIFTVGPSIERAISEGMLLSEFKIMTPFRIRLPTLHERLGQRLDGKEPGVVFRHIVDKYCAEVSHFLPRGNFRIPDVVLERWMQDDLTENYWGLRQKILEYLASSLDDYGESDE